MAILAPSILSSDYMHFHEDIERAKKDGAKWLHVDIMDGHFVPNLTFGYGWVKAMRKVTDLVLDVHLMIDTPIKYAEEFCKAGADYLTIHVEADTPENIHKTIELIRSLGVKPGVVVKPNTPAEAVAPYLEKVDMVLVMTVEPGFGGQKFMTHMMPKLKQLRQMIDEVNPACHLEVDGGVDLITAETCKENGANVLVAGSAFFGSADRPGFVKAIEK